MNRPLEDILLAQRATAYFLRMLNSLTDRGLDGPAGFGSPLSRRALVATVGYSARSYARIAEEARTGEAIDRAQPEGQTLVDEIELGCTLPAHALRHLVKHAAVHLSVEWRDLPDDIWSRCDGDDSIPVSETPWRRTVEVYLAAIDLGAGGSFVDIPSHVLVRMLAMQSSVSGVSFEVDEQDRVIRAARGNEVVRGALPDIVRWAFNRGDRHLLRNYPEA